MTKKRDTLSNKQRELIAFACLGMKTNEISETMSEWWTHASKEYIDVAYSRLYKKLGVSSRRELVKRALELGLITTEGKKVFITELKQII